MTGYGVILILVWTSSLTAAPLEACATEGWFGPDCVFKCRCQKACQQTGNCRTNDTCESGYTGTACQYADAAFMGARSPDAMNTSQEVVADAVEDQSGTCITSRSSVSATWMVQLTALSWVTQVNVHVPESRNLALKKSASKSPNDTNTAKGADKAVDYETNQVGPDTCAEVLVPSVTGSQSIPTVWEVYLGAHAVIWRVEIHDKMMRSIRNTGFHISVGVRNESMETVYETNATELQPSTVISLDTPMNATDVYIIHSTGRTLSLCDVRIFGDCLDGYYGWLCEDVCTCKDPAEVCDKVLGSCPQTGCRTGRRGLGCQERCAPGYYGDGCETKCDECIDEDCDPVNGTCMRGCLAGWTGDRCDEACPAGTYGNNCKNTCSVHCEDQDCFPGNGTCTNACPPGQTGSFCDKVCANGTYGYSCANICSDGCVESICHPVNGTCSRGCKTGSVGDDCSQEYTSVTFGPESRDKGSTNCASGEPPPNLSGIFATCFSIGFVISLAVYVTIKRCRCCVRNLSTIVYRV